MLVALVGNPNCGKTTLFNRLTGLRHKVANYPGVTVERREGRMTGRGGHRLLDLPGCYSLSPRSLDQRIARDALLGWADGVPAPDAVVVVVDASNLERNLFLATQAIELNIPTVVVCNMIDVVRHRGDHIDLERLGADLGVTVIGTVGSTGEGVDALRGAIARATEPKRTRRRWWPGPDGAAAIQQVADLLKTHRVVSEPMADAVAVLALTPAVLDEGDPSFATLPAGATTALAEIHREHATADASLAHQAVETRYAWITELTEAVFTRAERVRPSTSDRIDRIVTNRYWGMVIFG